MLDGNQTMLLYLIFGIILLIAGRRLFWLFVGIIGFITGMNLAAQWFANQPIWLVLLVSVVIGIIGALLAIFLQGVAVAVVGFLAGGYLFTSLLAMLGLGTTGEMNWIIYIIGGVIGALLAMALLDWALIILSSLAGANLIVTALAPQLVGSIQTIAFLVLFLIGVVIQAGVTFRQRRPIRRYRRRRRVTT